MLQGKKVCSPWLQPQGVIGRKIAENQYFYVNLTGKEQKIELPENGYGGAAGEKDGRYLHAAGV